MWGWQQGAGPARVTRQQPSGECAGCARGRAGWRAQRERGSERASERASQESSHSLSHTRRAHTRGRRAGPFAAFPHLTLAGQDRVPVFLPCCGEGGCVHSCGTCAGVWGHCKHTQTCVVTLVEMVTRWSYMLQTHAVVACAPPQQAHTPKKHMFSRMPRTQSSLLCSTNRTHSQRSHLGLWT